MLFLLAHLRRKVNFIKIRIIRDRILAESQC